MKGLSYSLLGFLFSCASADYFVLKQQIEKKPAVIVVYQPLRGESDNTSLLLAKKNEFSNVAVDVAEVIRKEEKLNVSIAYCNQRMGEHCTYSAIATENPDLKLPLRPPEDGSMLLFYVYARGDYRHKSTEGFPPECTLAMNVDVSPSDVQSHKIGGVYSRNNFYSKTHKGSECLREIRGLMGLLPPGPLLPEVREKLQAETRKILQQARNAQKQ
ncbi:MAG: hypothetical protein JNM27_16035 [Leptospirales bacterium]|nr:hypothetical protein [Leptospirales bacterium]